MSELATDKDFDLGQLSPSQQEALQQYTDVTSQDHKDAIVLLQRSHWNVQLAIAEFFDGEGPSSASEVTDTENHNDDIPRVASRYDTLQDNLMGMDEPRVPRSEQTELAPRVVLRSPITQDPPFFLRVLLAPFHAGYRFAAFLLYCIFYILSFLPESMRPRAVTATMRKGWKSTNGRRMLLPQDTAARFKREFEEEYGEHSLPFFEGGHAQAMDTAKRDVKFLLIILIAPENDDTEPFTKQTLMSPEVTNFIKDPSNNLVLWAGNILDSEAYQVSLEYNCTKFPTSILVSMTPREGSTRMGIIKRLTGPMPPATYLAALQGAMTRYAPDLDSVRAERVALEATRNLRIEQDAAYQRSLAIDLEKARKRREAEQAAAAAEKKAQEEALAAERLEQKRQQWRKWRATTVAAESVAKDAVRLALNMPQSSSAGRVVHKFSKETTLEELYAYVECYDLLNEAAGSVKVSRPEDYQHEYTFRISSVMPRETLHPSEQVTVAEKVGRGGNLIVEDIPHDETDDDE